MPCIVNKRYAKKVPLKFYFEASRGDVGAFFSFVEACYFRDRERLSFFGYLGDDGRRAGSFGCG